MLWLVIFLSELLTFSGPTNEPIQTCATALNLTAEEANQGRPIKVRAAVTCYISAAQLCFVQDSTAGIYAYPREWSTELKVGDVVDVEGISATGRYSPIIQAATLRRTGEQTNILPSRISIEELNTGRFDAQWLQLEGVVRSAVFADGVCTLQLCKGESTATILSFNTKASPTNLADAVIRISGVGGTFHHQDRVTGFGLFAPGPEHLQILAPAIPIFEAPLRKIQQLSSFSREGSIDRRLRIKGVVTVAWPGDGFFVQDDSGAVKVEAVSGQIELHPGDLVEAAGFVRDPKTVPRLEHTVIRKLDSIKLPEAAPATFKELFSKRPSGRLQSVEGTVSCVRGSETGTTVIELEAGNESLLALLKQPSGCTAGARVRLTGAWGLAPAALQGQLGPVLWLNSRDAITTLAPPPPRDASRYNRNVFFVSTLAALGIMVAVLVRGRRTEQRFATLELASAEKMTEMERELQRLNDARERLGRDLHDRIIQGIYAVGLTLEDCAQCLHADTKVEGRIKAAVREMNGVITELRNVILGLETDAIQPREFRTAIKSLALALRAQESHRIRIDIDEDALTLLTPVQATELVHIAREALSNSIRHGSAQTTSFSLKSNEQGIRFTIEDDGRGFNLTGAEGRGFGLRNMAKRAEHLGAIFRIESEEGHGTRVLLDIPRQKSHFSNYEPRARINR